MNLLLYLGATAIFWQTPEASKILALMTVPSHSHHLWNKVYLNALAARGHEVTYIGVDEYENPPKNIRYVLLENAYELYKTFDFHDVAKTDIYSSYKQLFDWYDVCTNTAIQQPGFQKFLNIIKTEKFDLVAFDLSATAFLLGAVDILGRPPVLGLTAFGIPPWTLDITGTPYPIQNNPHYFLPFRKNMTFVERLENGFYYMFSWVVRELHLKRQDAAARKVFGEKIRSVKEIENSDIHINIVNANWATDNPFAVMPGLIPISGMHIAKVKPLPEDLKKFLDSATHGVIYFSLGSNIQSAFLHEKELTALVAAFRRLAPVKVLWKYEKDELPGKPDNVHIAKWLPQNDILGHPNVRLFFTHGGMLSSQEAVYHGVPIVGMPVFLDQHVNTKKAAMKGYGEVLSLEEITADVVVTTIRKILENPRYKKTAVELSAVFRDQMLNPLDQAVYWTEYAIRHKGAPHLRPASKDLNFLQSGLYDILGVIFAILCAILFSVILAVTIIVKFFFRSKKVKVQ